MRQAALRLYHNRIKPAFRNRPIAASTVILHAALLLFAPQNAKPPPSPRSKLWQLSARVVSVEASVREHAAALVSCERNLSSTVSVAECSESVDAAVRSAVQSARADAAACERRAL